MPARSSVGSEDLGSVEMSRTPKGGQGKGFGLMMQRPSTAQPGGSNGQGAGTGAGGAGGGSFTGFRGVSAITTASTGSMGSGAETARGGEVSGSTMKDRVASKISYQLPAATSTTRLLSNLIDGINVNVNKHGHKPLSAHSKIKNESINDIYSARQARQMTDEVRDCPRFRRLYIKK